MYCTIDQARAAGATGTDPEVSAAITAAGVLVDARTGTWWEPRDVTVRLRVGADGFTPCPWVIQDVDTVTPLGGSSPLSAAAYTVLSSTIPGGVDALAIRSGGADPLVVGAEPWNGGWANLLASVGDLVDVAGTFGPATTPAGVAQATAVLAAWLRSTGGVEPRLDVDAEGNSLTITLREGPVGPRPSTGLPEADALLDLAAPPGPRVVMFS